MSAETGNVLELRLRELAQLFNSMDPSPFHDRDLDADADAFLVDWARELPAGREFALTIHLALPPPPEKSAGTEEAVRNYYRHRAETKARALRRMFRIGRWSLLIGFAFLAACLALAQLVGRLAANDPLLAPLQLAFDIIGWVALWRPVEIFLYDWWPLRQDQRLFERLARMTVQVVPPAAGNSV